MKQYIKSEPIMDGCCIASSKDRKRICDKICYSLSYRSKLYKNGMGGIDLMDQQTAAYRLDLKLSVRFYLHIFFDLLDIAYADSFLVYNMKHPEQLTLLS